MGMTTKGKLNSVTTFKPFGVGLSDAYVKQFIPIVTRGNCFRHGRRSYTDAELLAAIRAEQAELERQFAHLERHAIELQSRGSR